MKKLISRITLIAAIIWILVIILRHSHVTTGGDLYMIAPWIVSIGLFVLSIMNIFKEIRTQEKIKNQKSKQNQTIGVFVSILYAFFAGIGLFMVLVITIISYSFKNSNLFVSFSEMVETNPVVQQQTGEVYSYSTIISGKRRASEADLHFKIFAEKRNLSIHLTAHKENGEWIFDEIEGMHTK